MTGLLELVRSAHVREPGMKAEKKRRFVCYCRVCVALRNDFGTKNPGDHMSVDALNLPPEFRMILDVVCKKVVETEKPSTLPTSRLVAEISFWNAAALQYDSQLADLLEVEREAKGVEEKAAVAEVVALFKQLPEVGRRCAAELDYRLPGRP